MKKALLTLVFIFIFLIGFKYSSYAANRVTNQRCLTITGTFTAKNWVGGSMEVGCGGDNGKFCKGQVEKVKPGKKFTLSKCSCPPFASGCLVIGRNLKLKNDGPKGRPRVRVIGDRVPNKCKLEVKKNVCGRNGDVITGNFKVSCKKDVCPVPPKVLNVKVTCPNCNNANAIQDTVTISSVDPNNIPANYSELNTRLTINGSGFKSDMTTGASGPYDLATGKPAGNGIDNYYLEDLNFESSTKIDGLLPAGIPQGYYKIFVQNSSGEITMSDEMFLLVQSQNEEGGQ